MNRPTSSEDYNPEAALPGYEPRTGWNVFVGNKVGERAGGWIVHIPEHPDLGGIPWKAWGKAEAAVARKYNSPVRELLSAVFRCDDPEKIQVFTETRTILVAYGAVIRRKSK